MRFRILSLRCILAVMFCQLGASAFGVEHGRAMIYLAAVLGTIAGTSAGKLTGKVAGLALVAWLAMWTVEWLAVLPGDFLVFRNRILYEDSLLVFLYCLGSTWAFWRFKLTTTIELVLVILGFIAAFSPHRNYNYQAIEFVREWAWETGISASILLLLLGSTLLVALYFYLFSVTRLSRSSQPVSYHGESLTLPNTLLALVLGALLLGLGASLDSWYQRNAGLGSEGVGSAGEEGESPLNFNSDVGKSSTVSALVRLDTDYLLNPWSPLLYFREQAVSAYNGRLMVVAAKEFDRDIPVLRPGESYYLGEDLPLSGRMQLSHSVYLLTKHPYLFAIDYPSKIAPIVNPEKNRFLATYRAESFVPAFEYSAILDFEVGSRQWTEQEWEHYLRAPGSKSLNTDEPSSLEEAVVDQNGEDLRYRVLANSIVDKDTPPVEKAFKIVDYLADTSIYTRSPGHGIKDNPDPVIPYLFSEDRRGYCVHFAVAATYLMRLVGVPARVATGYMIDLKYAKDGHVLLHEGDRHSWPEIYVRDVGWIAIDVSPSRSEGEQELVPDPELLQDLMSKIDPTDFIDESDASDVVLDEDEGSLSPQRVLSYLFVAIICLLIGVYALKIFFRRSVKTVLGAYRSYYTILLDRGVSRKVGETRAGFSRRVFQETGIDGRELAALIGEKKYSTKMAIEKAEIDKAYEDFKTSYAKNTGFLKRFEGYVSFGFLRWFVRW